jgi:hypothetical protein
MTKAMTPMTKAMTPMTKAMTPMTMKNIFFKFPYSKWEEKKHLL